MAQNRIDKEICEKVLTLGCQYVPVRGGIAQLLSTYDAYVYEDFNFCANSGGGNFLSKMMKAFLGVILFLKKMIFDRKIKIVHIHTASHNSFWRSSLYVNLTKLFRKKVLLHIHGGDFRNFYKKSPKRISRILNRCDMIVTLTPTWKRYFEDITDSIPVEVVENVITPPRLNPQDAEGDVIHFLFLGKICAEKGIYDLLSMLTENRDVAKSVMLHIGGNGEVDKLKAYISDNNLQDCVIFEGWVDENKKADLFNLCEISILPSYAEGMPISLIEAMSYGLYTVSTKVGGIPEVITSEVGTLYDAGDNVQLLNSIRYVINNIDTIRNNRQSIVDASVKYMPGNVSEKLNLLYSTLLNS